MDSIEYRLSSWTTLTNEKRLELARELEELELSKGESGVNTTDARKALEDVNTRIDILCREVFNIWRGLETSGEVTETQRHLLKAHVHMGDACFDIGVAIRQLTELCIVCGNPIKDPQSPHGQDGYCLDCVRKQLFAATQEKKSIAG